MDKLKFINEQMESIGIPYEFGLWTSPVPGRYWVGECTEEPNSTEDGLEQSTIILTGFSRGELIDLEKDKAKIKSLFSPVYGLRGETDSGTIAVFYDGAFSIPSGEADLWKMQINLKIQEWKGAI